MKTRNDFVSNSSSCSFVLSAEKRLFDAIEFFGKTFDRNEIPYGIDENVRITCTAKNKWYKYVYEKITGEKSDWKNYYTDYSSGNVVAKDPEEIGWDYIDLTFSQLIDLANDKDILSKINEIRFQCEDSDETGCFYLELLYLFFERGKMCPDASDSEHLFVGCDSERNIFIMKLAGGEKLHV